ncbi:MAG: tetratricopeptide repeat protein [Pseudomonadota bacterium]|nr:tetratricopeptide repeat protein [Pseudomonadota bacterium]
MKKRTILILPLLLVFLFLSPSYAQKQSEIDKCFNYTKAGDYQKAIEAGKKAVKLYPKDADAHYCLSQSYQLTGRLNPALEHMKKAEKYASSKQQLMLVYNQFGIIYWKSGDLDNAIMFNSRYMSLARELGDTREVATALNNLAVNYSEKGDLDKALEYYEEALRLKTDEVDKAPTYDNIAAIYAKKGDYQRAVKYLEKSIEIKKKYGDYHGLACSLLNFGDTYRQMKDFDKGLAKLLEGLAMIKKAGDKFWEACAYRYIGWLYMDKGDKTSAKTNLFEAYNLYKSIGAKAGVADVLFEFSMLEKRTPKGLYAGIEIGSKGVKGMVVEILPTDEEGFYNLNEIMRHNIDTSIISGVAKTGMFTDEAIEETATAVKKIMDIIVERANIKKEDIHIVGSSALAYVQNAGTLEVRVNKMTGSNMGFAYKDTEVLYGLIGSVPNKYQASALLIDVGSGNTKFGYLVDGGKGIVSAELPYGTVSLTDEAKKINPSGANYPSTLSDISVNKLAPLLKQESTKNPPVLERAPVFMVGGAVWAMATILYPENHDTFMRIKTEDINRFYEMAVKKKNGIFNVDLSKIKNKETRANAEKQINSVKKVFTPDNIMAGATILKSISENLKLNGREIYFSRYGSWIFGYISTIGIDIEYEKQGGRK